MKLPKEVKILNHVYKVIEVDKIETDDIDVENETDQVLGLLDDINLCILICKDIQPTRKYQVFLHEVTHAIFNVIDFRRYLKDPESEESLVNFLSDLLLQVLVENNFKPPTQNIKKSLQEDNILSKTILQNHKNGISVSDISKTFQIEEQEVKKLINEGKKSTSATKKGKKVKKAK